MPHESKHYICNNIYLPVTKIDFAKISLVGVSIMFNYMSYKG